VDVEFDDARLGRICNDEQRMMQKLGRPRATRLGMRLSLLANASNLEELRHAPGRLHELTADRAHQFSLDLDHPYRLLFRPTENPPPMRADGGIDWSRVTAVTVIGIEDPH
jgi:plasmid maintenance system killer protein